MNVDPVPTTGQDHRSVLGKVDIFSETSAPCTDDGWTVVQGKKSRASVKKRDDEAVETRMDMRVETRMET
jgi:hypothetical protein